jgi:hypothetical protein
VSGVIDDDDVSLSTMATSTQKAVELFSKQSFDKARIAEVFGREASCSPACGAFPCVFGGSIIK